MAEGDQGGPSTAEASTGDEPLAPEATMPEPDLKTLPSAKGRCQTSAVQDYLPTLIFHFDIC